VGINLVKDLYDEKYKSLKNEMKETSEDEMISHAYGLTESTL
jgi:hypothetical protein